MTMELPEHLRTGPLAEQAAKALQDAARMAAASNSVPRLSLRGREFRLIENGEEVYKFRDHLDVIIMGVEPEAGRNIKTYYEKGYQSGAKEPPTCASDDGIAPSPWIQNKQSAQCGNCPKNQFGSAKSPSGKASKACRDGKRIWFKLASGNVEIGAKDNAECAESKKPLSERTLYGGNVTVASLKAFSEHGRKLGAMGQGPAVCVTRMEMQDKEYPELDFKLHAWLSADDAPQSLKIANERPWKLMFKNAGLALAGDGVTAKPGLPTMLPGQQPPPVPEHLQQVAQPQGTQTVVDGPAPVTKPVTAQEIDDQIGKW